VVNRPSVFDLRLAIPPIEIPNFAAFVLTTLPFLFRCIFLRDSSRGREEFSIKIGAEESPGNPCCAGKTIALELAFVGPLQDGARLHFQIGSASVAVSQSFINEEYGIYPIDPQNCEALNVSSHISIREAKRDGTPSAVPLVLRPLKIGPSRYAVRGVSKVPGRAFVRPIRVG
jgi:hypothetical protein